DDITGALKRFAMLQRAVSGNRNFYASRMEIDRQGVSYSVETLRRLRKQYPKAALYFLAGSDAIPELKTWKCIDEILSLCTFVIAPRPGFSMRSLPKKTKVLRGEFPAISSSAIRAAVRRGDSVRYLVPEAVCRFIRNHKLYQ
ncbi:MAG: nicotinate (nicotinamide) nucleotide adenylyltransferase, partial [Candidatus Omnitrophica bacterium]|nr:nicotinate (nicotinamide) nucleotide adenylyltransferase [Candidatus Omnitrophota bacterium]